MQRKWHLWPFMAGSHLTYHNVFKVHPRHRTNRSYPGSSLSRPELLLLTADIHATGFTVPFVSIHPPVGERARGLFRLLLVWWHRVLRHAPVCACAFPFSPFSPYMLCRRQDNSFRFSVWGLNEMTANREEDIFNCMQSGDHKEM